MPLAPGTKLGPYEILTQVGVGGMGEVYRARDTRLDRTVAIKILPAHLSTNRQLHERFEREARAISSLSHPHICPLYDVGHQDGLDFLVMEYLEGVTLAERIGKAPLPLHQTLQYAIQIADALDAAHRHGVIHRDLKPTNIIVTKTGAKLLDFGLAKIQVAGAAAGMTVMATQSTPLTGEGAILGTLQYMAPEQLEGVEADARADIFALGTVIYEMATGHKAFAGKSQASLISAIMTSEPPPVSSMQSMSPPMLDHVVKTCLAKDPDARWQTAHDILIELKWLTEAGSPAAGSAVMARHKGRELLPWTLLMVVSIFAVILSTVYLRRQPAESHAIRFQVSLPDKMDMDWFDLPVISPDGQRLILAGRASDGVRHLWLRSLDSLTTQMLPGTEGAFMPFWSPDSRSIAFSDGERLKVVDAVGGPAVTLCNACYPGSGDWNKDGVILFSEFLSGSTPGIFRVSAAGGESRPVLQLDKSRSETDQMGPNFLPDGQHFLYVSHSTDAGKSGIYIASLDSKETRMLLATESNASYVPPGFLLYGRQQTLLAQPFDTNSMRLTGEAIPIAEHVGRVALAPFSQFSTSQNGVLVYSGSTLRPVQLTWRNRAGMPQATIGEPGIYGEARLSPDEKRLVLTRINPETGTSDLWILELSTGILSRVTPHPSESPQWSPDGQGLVFSSRQNGHLDLYRKVIGGGREELVLQSDEDEWASQWLKDDSILTVNPSGKIFYRLRLAGGEKTAILSTDFENNDPVVSSDGRWVAYQSKESGRWEIYVASFPSFSERRQVSNSGGCQPHWRKDGREIFYLSLDGNLMSVERSVGSSTETAAPRVLFKSALVVDAYNNVWDVAGDGKKFVFGEPVGESGKPVNVVLNWTEGLKH